MGAHYAPGSPEAIEIAEKERKALDLPRAGATYDFIARQVGYSEETGARDRAHSC